jgi:thymidylate synthase (FAD)
MGDDLSVVNAARVSFDKVHLEMETGDEKLIKYLADHNHWSPFAHTSLQFHIRAPIFVARQLAKHQVGLVWNEVSRRYVSDDPDFYIPEEWRGSPEDKKQGSSDKIIDINKHNVMNDPYQVLLKKCLWTYQHLLEIGVAPEQARMVLPQSAYTEWYWTGSLYAFSRVCKLRQADDAQAETRHVADQISERCKIDFPVSWRHLCG